MRYAHVDVAQIVLARMVDDDGVFGQPRRAAQRILHRIGGRRHRHQLTLVGGQRDTGVRVRGGTQLRGRALRNDLSAAGTPLGSHVDDPVS